MLHATIDARRFVPVSMSTPFPGCDEYNVGMCAIGCDYRRRVCGGEHPELPQPQKRNRPAVSNETAGRPLEEALQGQGRAMDPMLFSDRYQPNESQRRTPNRMRAGRRDAANPERCRFRVVVRATWGAAASAPASPAVPPFDAAARTRMAHSVQRKDALDANLVGCHATSRPSLDSQATRTSPSLQASRCAPWRRVRSGDIDHAPAKRWE